MNKINSFIVLFLTSILMVSCGKEDTTPPIWEFNKFIPEAKSGDICGQVASDVFFVKGGDIFEFDAVFKDDEELSQYKIDIHQNFDCHGHSKTSDWSVLEVIDLSGTEELINKQLFVPENVTAGNYHFIIQLVDASGNQAENSFIRDFIVLNPTDTIPPTVELNTPNSLENLTVERGSTLNFNGTVVDNFSLLEGGNGRLIIDFVNQSNQNIFEGVTDSIQTYSIDPYNFNLEVPIPSFAPKGSYNYRVYAFDGVNNQSEKIQGSIEFE